MLVITERVNYKEYKSQIKKRKQLYIIACIFSLLFTVVIILLTRQFWHSAQIIYSYEGLEYQVGNTSYSKEIPIKINGYYNKNLFNPDLFEGEITIGEKVYDNLQIVISKSDNQAYGCTGKLIDDYGIIFLEEGMKSISIYNFRAENSYSIEQVYNFSAPSVNRDEAVQTSIKLFSTYLGDRIKYIK